eukprot:Phypoly_transcript_04429.p1 GENE.Phypoly_transcript_04429~~Phypoly_transcript_04429.p1  ORF type:complete len:478 (+),score=79.92 Phypoly_transcript_04429:725-2158(+)
MATAISLRDGVRNSYTITKDVSTWNVDDVADWARAIPDVIEDDITVLRNQRVNGPALVALSYDKLVIEPFKLTGGIALLIETQAKRLTDPQQTIEDTRIFALEAQMLAVLKIVRELQVKDCESISRISTNTGNAILRDFHMEVPKKIVATIPKGEEEAFVWVKGPTKVDQHPKCLDFIKEKILLMEKEEPGNKSTVKKTNKKAKQERMAFKNDDGRWIVTNKNNMTVYAEEHKIKGVIGDIREEVMPIRNVFELKPTSKVRKPDSTRQAALALVLALYYNEQAKLVASTTTSTTTTTTTTTASKASRNNPTVFLTDLATSCWEFKFNCKTHTILRGEISSWEQLTNRIQRDKDEGGVGEESEEEGKGDEEGEGDEEDEGGEEGGDDSDDSGGGSDYNTYGDEGGGTGSGDSRSSSGSHRGSRQKRAANEATPQASKIRRRPLFAKELDLEHVIEQTLSLPLGEQKLYLYTVCLAYMN